MKNLTKLFCELLTAGTEIKEARFAEQVKDRVKYLAWNHLPEDCDIDLDEIEHHIYFLRSVLRRGSDQDIDKPKRAQRVVDFHGKLTVNLDDGSELTLDFADVPHY